MPEIFELTFKPKSKELEKSHLIINECALTLNSLLSIHHEIENVEEKEDLLRAMFVFATGGLDSLIKQAIKDSLSNLIEVNEGANNMFESFVEKEIQDKKSDDLRIDSKLMAKLLTSANPREELKKRLEYHLTSNSLQSKDQILKVASFFDVPSNSIVTDFIGLQSIFLERNKIIHEMDINFDGDRSRNKREIEQIVNFVNTLLELGEKFIKEVDSRLYVA
ncbi:hypothetical protein [Gillisia sp. JM1]|uniref:hypothetical protein n=1 Tax=Gillisia sp. JM1 TaxID=1283286 RepID=UPI000421C9BC|nr:hypothetical protein [Gillisia sp. JM1]